MDTFIEAVPITDWDDFREGDVVAHLPTDDDPDFVVTREVAEDKGPKAGTFGWATVDGDRRKGFLDTDLDFIFPNGLGETNAVPSEFWSDFLEDK